MANDEGIEEAFKKGCDLGDGEGCLRLGEYLLDRKEMPITAMKTFEFGCSRDEHAESCRRLGAAYFYGENGAQDIGKALFYANKACDAGLSDACVDLAIMRVDGPEEARNPGEAEAFSRRACGAGGARGCVVLARLLKNGMAIEREPGEAEHVLNGACLMGMDLACQEVDSGK